MTLENRDYKWRFWPILLIGSLYAFSSPILSLAIPLYFFQQGVQVIFISFLTTAITITYSFSPLLFVKLSNRIGRKKSLIISLVGVFFAEISFYFTLDPVIFLIERLFEGLLLGFLFPNLTASISDNQDIDHSRYLAKFNLSWSASMVLGLIFGTIFLMISDEMKLIFYIMPFIILVDVLLTIFFFHDPIKSEINTQKSKIETSNPQKLINTTNFNIPLIIPVLYIFTMSVGYGISGFLYPIKSETLGFHPSSAYFLTIFSNSARSVSLYLVGMLKIKLLKVLSIISTFSLAILVAIFAINNNYFIFIILFTLLGFLSGVLYGIASSLFINLNVIKQTSFYSSLSESLVGIGFFITLIFAGFIADVNLELAFYAFVVMLIIISLLNLFSIRKLKMV